MFRVYYADGTVFEGRNRNDWRKAPNDGVQAVVEFPRTQPVRWFCTTPNGENRAVRDRNLWTGEDAYDPFGWGTKNGSLIDDASYFDIWGRACADPGS